MPEVHIEKAVGKLCQTHIQDLLSAALVILVSREPWRRGSSRSAKKEQGDSGISTILPHQQKKTENHRTNHLQRSIFAFLNFIISMDSSVKTPHPQPIVPNHQLRSLEDCRRKPACSFDVDGIEDCNGWL